MEPVERLRRKIKVLTFDQYGTVVDMQKGLTEVVTPFLERKGWHGDPHRFEGGGGSMWSAKEVRIRSFNS